MKAAAIAIAIALAGPAAAADRCPIGVMLGSVHFDPNREDQLSGVNPGAYLLCEDWTAGAYRDSRRRAAAFGGVAFQNEGAALVIGAKLTRDGLEAFVAGSLRMGFVRLIATPPIGKTPAALAIAMEF